jgi:hypothetical protein
MEENGVNTNSTPSALHLEHDQSSTPSYQEKASSREAGGWRSVKYIIGMYMYCFSTFINNCYKHDLLILGIH